VVALVVTWSAPVLVVSYELLMPVIRSGAAVPESVPVDVAALNGHALLGLLARMSSELHQSS
jgi:hypothetical protein